MTAVFRKAWSQLWPEMSPVASIYGERVIEDSIEMLSLNSSRESSAAAATRMQQRPQQQQQLAPFGGRNNIAAIDENAVFQNDDAAAGRTVLYDDYTDPVSLPNLGRYRPVCTCLVFGYDHLRFLPFFVVGCLQCAASEGGAPLLGLPSNLCV